MNFGAPPYCEPTPCTQPCLVEMLHSCTPSANKEYIIKSFQQECGFIRALIATIAFGMGVNCQAVSRVIHFGLSKNIKSYAQETGRVGRNEITGYSVFVIQWASFKSCGIEHKILY